MFINKGVSNHLADSGLFMYVSLSVTDKHKKAKLYLVLDSQEKQKSQTHLHRQTALNSDMHIKEESLWCLLQCTKGKWATTSDMDLCTCHFHPALLLWWFHRQSLTVFPSSQSWGLYPHRTAGWPGGQRPAHKRKARRPTRGNGWMQRLKVDLRDIEVLLTVVAWHPVDRALFSMKF